MAKADMEGQVTIHCMFKSTAYGDKIRIWKSTYLFDRHSSHQSDLVHFENITLFPEWKSVPLGKQIQFTLIFSKLPKQCKVFDLREVIPQEGGFEAYGLRRNKSDVYYVEF
ncbi:MAG TPA: hypothetical protein DCQ93_04570 [Bacteroidetes bacterium]|nr:hypothetical protein [Bacteroidota bacterium]